MSYQNLDYLTPWAVLDSISKSKEPKPKSIYHRNILSDEVRALILREKANGLIQKEIFEKHGSSIKEVTPHNIHVAFRDSK